MKRIVVKDNKVKKHNFKGKLLESVKKSIEIEKLENGKYEVINLESNFHFRKIK